MIRIQPKIIDVREEKHYKLEYLPTKRNFIDKLSIRVIKNFLNSCI